MDFVDVGLAAESVDLDLLILGVARDVVGLAVGFVQGEILSGDQSRPVGLDQVGLSASLHQPFEKSPASA